jgi:hypothetical protein
MASKVELDRKGLKDFFMGEEVKSVLMQNGEKVKKAAASTAGSVVAISSRLIGYASGGFTVEYQRRSSRPRVIIYPEGDSDLTWRAHFASQKVKGVAHMRAALYSTIAKDS